MSANEKLAPCRVCGRQPKRRFFEVSGYYATRCEVWGFNVSHSVETRGRTQAEADARWRRLAGGRK